MLALDPTCARACSTASLRRPNDRLAQGGPSTDVAGSRLAGFLGLGLGGRHRARRLDEVLPADLVVADALNPSLPGSGRFVKPYPSSSEEGASRRVSLWSASQARVTSTALCLVASVQESSLRANARAMRMSRIARLTADTVILSSSATLA